jgi:hypothetical protein
MVTVQLVEKNVNRKVGTVIVENRMVQYRNEEMRCKMAMTSQAKRPSQLDVPCVATTSWARSSADGRAEVDALSAAEMVVEADEAALARPEAIVMV